MKKRIFSNIGFYPVIMTFLAVFHVPIFPVNILYILSPISYLYLINNIRKVNIDIKAITFFLKWLLLLIIYQSSISLINGYSIITTSVGMIWWLIGLLPICLSIIVYCRKNGCSLLKSSVIAMILQSICCLLAICSPELKAFFLRFVETENLIETGQYYFRLFGWANYLTGFTAMTMGVVASIFFYIAYNGRGLFYIFSLIAVIVGIVNARTSGVIFISNVVLILILSRNGISSFIKFILILFAVVLISIGILNSIDLYDNETIAWISEGVNEITSFLEGEDTGYFAYASNEDKYKLPEGCKVFFGEGTKIFAYSSKIDSKTDIGYINDIWIGGLFFLFLFYYFIFSILKLLYRTEKRNNNNEPLVLPAIFLIALLIANFKGIINTDNDLICLLILVLSDRLFVTKDFKHFYNETT